MIHVCLDRHGLPHIRLGLAVFRIERFFLVRKLPVLLFQRVHLRELRPVQKLIDRRFCRPVVGQLRLVLGQIFFRIPGRLVAVEHRPGLCVLHHSAHELGRAGKGLLRVPQLPGQGMKAIHRRLGAGRKSLVIGEPMLPEILERGGHLFEVVNLRPPRISRALALGQPFLDVDHEIDAPGRSRALLGELRDRTLPGNHRPDVLRVKARAQGGRAQAGGLFLPRGQERPGHASPQSRTHP